MITISEVIIEGRNCIHCYTEREANIVINCFKDYGFDWANSYHMDSLTHYGIFHNDTCYDIADGVIKADCIHYYKNHHYNIIDFNNIVFDNDTNSSISKYNCNTVIDFMHEKNRLCSSVKYECGNCCMSIKTNNCITCRLDSSNITQNAIDKLQEWSDTNTATDVLCITKDISKIFTAYKLMGYNYVVSKFNVGDKKCHIYATKHKPAVQEDCDVVMSYPFLAVDLDNYELNLKTDRIYDINQLI